MDTRTVKLTKRWRPLRPHPVQARLYHSRTRFNIIPAGRRSGKTELTKRKLARTLWDCLINPRPWEDPRFFASAPTFAQARQIWWKDLKALIPREWLKCDPKDGPMIIETKWGAELHVVGLDKPQRVEGVSWDGCAIDEAADNKPDFFDAHLRPALADRGGWSWLLGVPDMMAPFQVEYEKLYQKAQAKESPEWGAFHWPSWDILPAAEIESAKHDMDPRLYEQEFGGKFRLASGRAFPDFDYARHVKAEFAEYDPELPLCWSKDFNVNPMCSGIIQHHKGVVRVIDELELQDSQTSMACVAFVERCKERGWRLDNLEIYGDPTGHARDTTSGMSDWTIVRNAMKNVPGGMKLLVPKKPWPIKDTLNAVNARLHNTLGETRLYVHPRCKGLIKDLKDSLWPSALMKQHHVAWLRYFTVYRYPVLSETPAADNLLFAVAD